MTRARNPPRRDILKLLFLILILAAGSLPAHAHPRKETTAPRRIIRSPYGEHYVQGYTRRDGSYVPGHFRANTRREAFGRQNMLGTSRPYSGTFDPYVRRRTRTVRPYSFAVPAPSLETGRPSYDRTNQPVYSGAIPPVPPAIPPVPEASRPSYSSLPAPAASPGPSDIALPAQLSLLIGCDAAAVSACLVSSGYTLYKDYTQKQREDTEFRRGNDRVEVFYVNGVAARWKTWTSH